MMLAQQPLVQDVPVAAASSASAPKKRRRRAPATGASEDCFTCRNNGTKCDRRRPYCGPCLEIGDECKGYRTQLTWGVGVASRGKLRGMTLPISIESNISVAERDKRAANMARKKSVSVDDSIQRDNDVKMTMTMENNLVDARQQVSKDFDGFNGVITSYDFVNIEHPTAPTAFNTMPRAQRPFHARSNSMFATSSSTLEDVYAGTFSPINDGHSLPHALLDAQRNSYSVSPPQSSPSILIPTPMTTYEPMYHGRSYSLSPPCSDSSVYGASMESSGYLQSDSMTDSGSLPPLTPLEGPSLHDQHFIAQAHSQNEWGTHNHVHNMGGNLSDLLYGEEMLALNDPEFTYSLGAFATPECSSATSYHSQYFPEYMPSVQPMPVQLEIPPQLHIPQQPHLAPELRALVDYYDRIVCPSLVAFDGPTNPYRMDILPLAFENEALLEAVYALASSHIQQARKASQLDDRRMNPPQFSLRMSSQSARTSVSPSPRSSSAFSLPPDLDEVDASSALHHKNASIKLLNSQLATSALAVTDSALATLLILCLYHVCEAGVGQFKTHLAGVKKLMGMRRVGRATGRWSWMETVFTYFDNISATINDRDAQLSGEYLDMIENMSDDWDLESLTGCNRHLFKRLAGLGRINMLSQQDPVYIKTDYSSPHDAMDEDDEDDEPARNEHDGRTEFWREWNAMKADLLSWKPCSKYAATPSRHKTPDSAYSSIDFDFSQSPTFASSVLSGGSSPHRKSSKAYEAVEKGHWLHASNVYRYAAILYLDRLAYPHLPSAHPVFQNTVREVLDHLTCVPTTSGLAKSLMWPLFITGSECVVDEHRMLIRERCFDMQKDCGFFNKITGLDVLEKIWKDDFDQDGMYGLSEYPEPGIESVGGRGLKWRKVTSQDEGEYLMI